jgi:hypothetical protein
MVSEQVEQAGGKRRIYAVERVFHDEPELGIALDAEPAVEEQRIGIFLAQGEQQELARAGAHRDVRRGAVVARQVAVAADPHLDADARVANVDADHLAPDSLRVPGGERVAQEQGRQDAHHH